MNDDTIQRRFIQPRSNIMLLVMPIILVLELFLFSMCMSQADALSSAKPSAAKRLQSLLCDHHDSKKSHTNNSHNNKRGKNNNANAGAIVLPGVHDALSAKIFAKTGRAKALFLSGFGVSACRLGEPDMGILTLTEMEENDPICRSSCSRLRLRRYPNHCRW
jgi:Phosphoenolpyruvate phosphomutase